MKRKTKRFRGAPKPDDIGFKDYWFARELFERHQACARAVNRKKENLLAIKTADQNLRNYIAANIHDPDFMNLMLDAVDQWRLDYELRMVRT